MNLRSKAINLQSIYYILWRFAWQEQILKKNAGAIPGMEYAEAAFCAILKNNH